MADKKNFMPFVYIILLVFGIIAGVVIWNKTIVEPRKHLMELENENKELNKSITILNNTIKQNLTQKETVTETRYVTIWTILGWLAAFILLIYLLFKRKNDEIKLLPEIIKEMRKFAREEDHIELYGLVYANAGFSGGKESNAVYLVLFCTDRTWMMTKRQEILPGQTHDLNKFIEPPKAFIYGYYGNARKPRDIKLYVKNTSVTEVLERLKKVEWGMERPYMSVTEEPAWKQQLSELKVGAVVAGEQLKTLDETRFSR